jgi:hypothetical protein
MVVSSGNIPYAYDTLTPVLKEYCVSPSGSMLEQGQFIVTAEIRKWTNTVDSHRLERFNVFDHPFEAPQDVGYEPKIDGSNQNLLGNLTNVGPIIQTRRALEKLFDLYKDDSPYTSGEHHVDWIKQTYPVSLSGQVDIPNAEVDDIYPGFTRREVASGTICDTDVDILGGSGTYIDLDFGEIMFNPYPFHRRTQFSASFVRAGTFVPRTPIWTAPFFPNFQKTDGDLIGLNGREPNLVINDGLYQVEHIGSGKVRLDGYGVDSRSEVFLQNINGAIPSTKSFTHTADGIRKTGINTRNTPQSRVFLTPTAQTSGIYRSIVRYPSSVVPEATVSSGQISVWPHPSSTWPIATSGLTQSAGLQIGGTSVNPHFVPYNQGYFVFDDTFWLQERHDGTQSSGLLVLSPFTGHRVWLRHVDPTTSASPYGGQWVNHNGLEIDSGTIYRLNLTEVADPMSAVNNLIVAFERYNFDLDYLGQSLTDTLDNTGGLFDLREFAASSSTAYILIDNTSTSRIVTTSFPGLLHAGTFSSSPSELVEDIHYAAGSLYASYDSIAANPELAAITFTTVVAPNGTFATGTRKEINLAPVVKDSPINTVGIQMVRDVSASHITNGVWALIVISCIDPGVAGSYLIRISEGAFEWSVLEHIKLERGTQGIEFLTMSI